MGRKGELCAELEGEGVAWSAPGCIGCGVLSVLS